MQITLEKTGVIKAMYFMIFHPQLNSQPYKVKTQNGVTIGTFNGFDTISSFPFNNPTPVLQFRVYDLQDRELFLLPYPAGEEQATANVFVQLE
jgi:hypothetical protein